MKDNFKIKNIHIIIAIIIAIVLYFGFYAFNRFQENNRYKRYNEWAYIDLVHAACENEEIKESCSDKECTMKVEDLLNAAKDFDTDIEHDEYGNDCIGYITFKINTIDNIFEHNFDNVCDKTSYITKVPGGVGPMTITCLLENTIECFLRHMEEE